MPNAMYFRLQLGFTIAAGRVVGLNSSGKLFEVDDNDFNLIGVTDESGVLNDFIRVVVMGRKTVTCTGTVAVGDPVDASATPGECKKLVPLTSIGVAAHTHDMSDIDTDGSSNTDSDTVGFVFNRGLAAGGNILGKALTGGTNTTIDVWVKVHG